MEKIFLNKKTIVISIIIWLVVIFTFSAMDAVKSNIQSKGVINKVVEKVQATNEGDNQAIDKNKTVNKLNKPVRKFAHEIGRAHV